MPQELILSTQMVCAQELVGLPGLLLVGVVVVVVMGTMVFVQGGGVKVGVGRPGQAA
jgi:hypothetical protein